MSDVTIRITLDAAELKAGLASVTKELTEITGKEVDIETGAAETKLEQLRDSTAMWGLAIQGAINTFKMIGNAVQALIQPGLDAEASQAALSASLQNTGIYTDALAQKIADYAGELQGMTIYEDDAIVSATALMLNIGQLAADQIPAAQKAAIGLAAAYRMDLETAFSLVGKAAAGNTATLARYGIVLGEGLEPGERFNQLLEIGASKFGLAEEAANTGAGAIEQFKNYWGDLVEELGHIIIPAISGLLRSIIPIIQALISFFQALSSPMKALIVILPLLTVAWYKLTAAKVTATVATGALTTAIHAATNAVRQFLVTIGPVGWVLLGLSVAFTAVGVATALTKKETDDLAESNENLQESISSVEVASSEEMLKFDALTRRLHDLRSASALTAAGQKELSNVVKELNDNFGNHLENIDLEKAKWIEIEQVLGRARDKLIQYYTAKVVVDKFDVQAKQLAEKKVQLKDWAKTLYGEDLDLYDELFTIKADRLVRKLPPNALMLGDAGTMIARPSVLQGMDAMDALIVDIMKLELEIKSGTADFTAALSKVLQLEPKGTSTGNSGGGGKAAVLSEYEKLSEELQNFVKTETEKLTAEYKRREALITKNTKDGSEERQRDMNNLTAWRKSEQAKIDSKADAEQAKIDQKRLSDLTDYYEGVKFLDEDYYDWKKVKIQTDVLDMGLSEEQARLLANQRIAVLDAEKEAYDRLPLDAVLEKYREFKREMSDTRNMGVAAWEAIRDGLRALKDELEQYADMPGVAEVLEKLQSEIDIAQLNAAGKKGNWFWHRIIGFDPDSDEDQAKIRALQGTFTELMGSFSRVTTGMLQIAQQRKQEELDGIDEIAEREMWSDERRLAAKEEVNKSYEAEERRLKNIQKNLSIVQAIINTAEGVTKALTLGPVLGPIMAGIIGAMGAAEIAIIRAQKFARGGLFRGIGGAQDDANLAMISDGEFIVNAASTRKFLPILKMINAAEGKGIPDGGGSYSFAGGGLVTNNGIFERLLEKLDILNLNLVKKDMSVHVETHVSAEEIVRCGDRSRKRMDRRGYALDGV